MDVEVVIQVGSFKWLFKIFQQLRRLDSVVRRVRRAGADKTSVSKPGVDWSDALTVARVVLPMIESLGDSFGEAASVNSSV